MAPTGSIPGDASNLDPLWGIVTNAPVPIFFKEREGSYVYVNEAYTQAILTPREQIIGRKDPELFPEPQASAHRASDLAVMSDGEPRPNFTTVTVAGEKRTFKTMKFPIFDTEGEVLGVCGISIDITDALVVERDLKSEREREIAAKPFERLLATLTSQEARIAELLMLGNSDKEIAEQMSLTPDTVRHHVSHVLKKLRKRSRTQAVIEMLTHRKDR